MREETVDTMETRIIGAARELFMEKGFESTSMSDIAGRLGINRPTLHYYFRTKDKMFQAVFDEMIGLFLPKIKGIFSKELPFLVKLEHALDEYIALFMKDPYLPRFILGESHRDMGHLMVTVKRLHLDTEVKQVKQMIVDEMEQGRLKKVPLPTLFLTFYSQMLFPFLSKEIVIALFYEREEEFYAFLQDWKKNILFQMKNLLEI